MEESAVNNKDSWLEYPVYDSTTTADSYEKCRHKLNNEMTPDKEKKLKGILAQNLMENIPGRKLGEDLRMFVKRRCHRNPLTNTTARTVERIKSRRPRRVKVDNKPSALEEKRQADNMARKVRVATGSKRRRERRKERRRLRRQTRLRNTCTGQQSLARKKS